MLWAALGQKTDIFLVLFVFAATLILAPFLGLFQLDSKWNYWQDLAVDPLLHEANPYPGEPWAGVHDKIPDVLQL